MNPAFTGNLAMPTAKEAAIKAALEGMERRGVPLRPPLNQWVAEVMGEAIEAALITVEARRQFNGGGKDR